MRKIVMKIVSILLFPVIIIMFLGLLQIERIKYYRGDYDEERNM